MGSDGDVEGEVDPNEPPGTALDSWGDATAAAALALELGARSGGSGGSGGGGGGGGDDVAVRWAFGAAEEAAVLRVLVVGLRCGAVPSFLCRHLPGVRVDVVEADAEVVSAGRDFFSLDFDEEPWGDLTPAGRVGRLKKAAPGGGQDGSAGASGARFRVWSGVSVSAFLADVPPGTFVAVLGDLPSAAGARAGVNCGVIGSEGDADVGAEAAMRGIVRGVRSALLEHGGLMVLAVNEGGALRAAAAAAAREDAFGAEGVRVACNPLEQTDEDDDQDRDQDGDGDGAPSAKRARIAPPPPLDPAETPFRGAAARGGVVVARRGGAGVPADFFSPSTWHTQVVTQLCKGPLASMPLPFAIESAESAYQSAGAEAGAGSKVVFVSYCAAVEEDEENHAPDIPAHALASAAANRGNTAWNMFGDGDEDIVKAAPAAAAAVANDVGSPGFWEEILGGGSLRCDGGGATSAPAVELVDVLQPITSSQADGIANEGFVWGGVVVPRRETEALAEGMRRLVAAGWPPVCIFTSDLAWLVVDRLWDHAEVKPEP